jgi:hypothetical protein
MKSLILPLLQLRPMPSTSGSGKDCWDACLSVALESSGIVDGLPNDTFGIHDGPIVKPGVLDDSLLFVRPAPKCPWQRC